MKTPEANVTPGSYEFEVLRKAWTSAGRKLGQPASHSCVVEDCRSMAFVALKINTGSQAVCFQHYALLEESEELVPGSIVVGYPPAETLKESRDY